MFRPNVYFKGNRVSCQDLFTITRRTFLEFLGIVVFPRKKRERRCLLAAPACVPLGYYALSGVGKVIPPTLTFTAAISSPVMDSMAFFTPSCTARPTSGMVWP